MYKNFLTIIAVLWVFMAQAQETKMVLLKTEFGDMKIKLYDETPLHRDNFYKLASEGFFNDLLFHRVIKTFMIQGGDPESKEAKSGKQLGNGGPGYTIPAEFNAELFHKKGALSAARLGDQMNPKKESSGSQFYVVQGKVYTNEELDQMEQGMCLQQNMMQIRKCMSENKDIQQQIDSVAKVDQAGVEKFVYEQVLIPLQKEDSTIQLTKFTEAQREAYTTVGGTPFLDGGYTVFGQVVEGLDVIDKIAEAQTDRNDRPIEDIKMTIEIIK